MLLQVFSPKRCLNDLPGDGPFNGTYHMFALT